MTAQHHDVQHETPAAEQNTAPDHTDPLGPITLPKRHKVGARAMALVGVVGMSTMAVAVAGPLTEMAWTTH
ncbi:hypothetical protein [Kribbella speibonae]|uniref:Uncharacterized protein n=1 Tax=Kribbella speibonae TaxID=1572660 RepID=A0A4R0JH39_9ACTN|nr:hypothetical protein [Kribbella speibonae]TCC21048.1 hypothetical protein E0H58_27350 [Kribbella speibonae]TCC41055.1 hypothetical protein E0H92_05110 [Kribbella speibonae]